MLQHVGLGLDRFGEVDPVVGEGEVDQEQHDAVRDVFVLPSACMLVRADLFRALGGYDPSISFHGDDVELCWRAHLTGARVVVAPDARVRHRERLVERRPDLNHRTLQSRHRMRAVATLTGGSRLFGRSVQLVALTLVEVVVGLFTGRLAEALSSLRALVGLIPRTASIAARRRSIRGQRAVPEREVLGLQGRGSSRLTSYLRGKETTTFVGADTTVRRWREASFGPVLAWFCVILAIVIGSRSFIRNGVPAVGEFLPFPTSPGDLLADYRSSFDPRSYGATAPNPTGWATLSVLSVFALFRMPLLMTLSVVGLYLGGALGAWRLATVFPSNRARIACTVVYVGCPLVPGLLGARRLGRPRLVRSAALAAPPRPPGGRARDRRPLGGDRRPRRRRRRRRHAPPGAGGRLRHAGARGHRVVRPGRGRAVRCGGRARRGRHPARRRRLARDCVDARRHGARRRCWPWRSTSRGPCTGRGTTSPAHNRRVPSGRSVAALGTLASDGQRFAALALALYVPVLAALAISRAWRLTWSARGASLVIAFGGVLVLADRGSLGVAAPRPSLLAVPVALGLALCAAAVAGGFGADVLDRGFGWRQPVGVLGNIAIVIGLVPGVIAIGHGAWHTPDTPLTTFLDSLLPVDAGRG